MTAVWLSSAVLKTCFRSVGMVVFFSTSLVMMPPRVSMPRLSGVTSKQQHVFHVAHQHAALNGRADGHDFVGIHALVRFLAEHLP